MSNRLLGALQASSRSQLAAFLEPVSFACGSTLTRVGDRVTHSYFVESGMISLVKTMKAGNPVEVTSIGYEGIVPLAAIFGFDRAILDSVVQIGGTGLRIARAELAKLIAQNEELARIVSGFGQVAINQLAQTAACNVLHSVEKRCCRWLLSAQDSARSDSFPLTHEYLGMMLGVRRASVSIAAQSMRRAGLIEYRRGRMTIKDRKALARAACECYAASRAELDRLFSEEPA